MAAEIAGQPCQTGAVVPGIGIARLNTKGKREEDGFGILQFIGEMLKLEQALDPGKKLFRVEGLAQEIVGSSLDAANAIAAVAETGDHDDWDQTGSGILLQFTAKIVSGASGHN